MARTVILQQPPTQWPAEALWEAVAPLLPGFTVEVLPEIDSTNTELMRRARVGQMEPILLVAERQTAGRGRMGRVWDGRAGMNEVAGDTMPPALTFSLGLPLAPRDWSGLSLVAGISAAESLGAAVRLKWPNDMWLAGDRKLGGILVETAGSAASLADRKAQRYVVIGMGVNISRRDLSQGGQAGSIPPAGLHEVVPAMDAPSVLARLVPGLVMNVLAFAEQGFAVFQERFNACDVLFGRAVRLSDGTEGEAQGVDASGALLVHTAHGVQAITSSEVSVRPVQQALPMS